jgi:hypothetical protein
VGDDVYAICRPSGDRQSFLVLVGLSHLAISGGAELTVGKGANGRWKILKQAKLRGAPYV